MFSNFFSPENRAGYEIMWTNVEPESPRDYIIRRMRFACWITKATDTHSEYVTFIAFRRQQCFREGASVLRCTYIASLSLSLSLCLFLNCI